MRHVFHLLCSSCFRICDHINSKSIELDILAAVKQKQMPCFFFFFLYLGSLHYKLHAHINPHLTRNELNSTSNQGTS